MSPWFSRRKLVNRLRPLSNRGKSGRLAVKMMQCKIDFGSLLGRTNNILNNAPGRHGRHLPATLGIKLRGTGGERARGSTSFKSGILSVEWDTTWALDCHGWISPELSLLWLWEHCLHSSSPKYVPAVPLLDTYRKMSDKVPLLPSDEFSRGKASHSRVGSLRIFPRIEEVMWVWIL